MKRQILLITALFFNTLIFTDPLLVAVLMVKNEAPVMELTLQPLVDAGITDFFIYDTGSTDNTIQITQNFFLNNNITHFVIEQGEFIDFATSRNRALELTELYFPDATFMLMLDAEWILHNGTDLLKYCKQHKNDFTTLYLIQIKGFNIELAHSRLFRCRSNISFVGKIHEIPNVTPQARIPNHIYFELSSTHYGKEKSRDRWLRDRDLLLEELQENPDNPRIVYYLAQTYFCLGDLQNAIKWYEHRTTLHGWDEENFSAYFCLAQVYESAGNAEKMINNYLKAFALRPHRAEPLIRLAEYYYNIKAYHLCYVFAKYAVTLPYPSNDLVSIEKYLYDFVRYNLLSCVAALVGDYKLGLQATLKALEAYPNEDYLQNNLKYYQSMLV
jgi:tetratricopeptide (TPR) repeat protein